MVWNTATWTGAPFSTRSTDCIRHVLGQSKESKRTNKESKRQAPSPHGYGACLFSPTNHLQRLLPGDFAGNTVVLSVHRLREIHRNRTGNLSEASGTEWSERPHRPPNFLIFPLPFLIFSSALEHSTPVRFLAKRENDFAPYRLLSAIVRGTAGARSFFIFAKRHTDFPFLRNFAPLRAIFGKNGFSVCPKKASSNILFEIHP